MFAYRLRTTHSVSACFRVVLVAFFALVGIGCGSDRDQARHEAEDLRPAAINLPAPEAEPVAALASPSTGAMYSDAPACNALVKRLADETIPCLKRVNPEYGERLQSAITNFGKNPRVRLDPANRAEVLRRTEEDCQTYWRQIFNQLDSTSPEGQCLFSIDN